MTAAAAEPTGPTIEDINAVMLPASQARGFCLCIHPMMDLINFAGTSCAWCLQPVTAENMSPEYKEMRTAALHAAWPPGHPFRAPQTGDATAGTPPEP